MGCVSTQLHLITKQLHLITKTHGCDCWKWKGEKSLKAWALFMRQMGHTYKSSLQLWLLISLKGQCPVLNNPLQWGKVKLSWWNSVEISWHPQLVSLTKRRWHHSTVAGFSLGLGKQSQSPSCDNSTMEILNIRTTPVVSFGPHPPKALAVRQQVSIVTVAGHGDGVLDKLLLLVQCCHIHPDTCPWRSEHSSQHYSVGGTGGGGEHKNKNL